MSKKLQCNGLWESSRMMLPEHKATIISNNEALKRRQRIELDEQEWEEISRVMALSLKTRNFAVIRMYHQYEDLQIVGIVDRIDQLAGQFLVDGEWFKINDIQGATLEGD
ncbi:YolD-like family protein [Paenibacillus sp. GXUN7292]|uniref:YolD-like family protein n=1 Tax=Paenibacillus sp. GXUN7292 TaxID=3422499 RepID=UPI003D7CBC4D